MTGMMALLGMVRSKFLVLMTWTLAGAAIAGVLNMTLPVVYEASAKILVATPYWNDSTALADPNVGGARDLAYGDEFTQQRMESYVRLVTTPMVTDPVAQRLRLGETGEELAKRLNGHIIPETVVLQVRAQDSSPARAASIADATARQVIEVIKEVERPPHVPISPVQPILTEPASVPSQPISPRTLLNVICGAVVGFLLGLTFVAAYAAAREGRFRGNDEGLSGGLGGLLGALMAEDRQSLDELHNDAKFLRLEVAQRMAEAGVQSMVMTSPRTTPATSIAAALLATALADTGASTIVVCADFTLEQRRPTRGLGDLFSKPIGLDSVIVSDERRGISWIPAGNEPANPTKDITGPKMRNLMIDLSKRYQHIIIVGPPVLELADAVDMASQVGASILVDPVQQTVAEELRESERLLRLAWGTYLGRVVVAGEAFSQQTEQKAGFRSSVVGRDASIEDPNGELWS